MAVSLGAIDHVAYPVRDIDQMVCFLRSVFDAREDRAPYIEDGVVQVKQILVGESVLSLHRFGNGISLAASGQPGCLDICFRWNGTINSAIEHLLMH